MMRRQGCVTGLVLAVWLLSAHEAWAEDFSYLPLDGQLEDEQGRAIDKAVTMTFTLYTTEKPSAAGDAVYEETISDVKVEQGEFAVYLGEQRPLSSSLFRKYPSMFVGVRVGDDEEMRPLLRLAPVPYAAYAAYCGDAATLGGKNEADLAYVAGDGLLLSGHTFSSDPSQIQRRITGSCDEPGQALKSIGADGSVRCESAGAIPCGPSELVRGDGTCVNQTQIGAAKNNPGTATVDGPNVVFVPGVYTASRDGSCIITAAARVIISAAPTSDQGIENDIWLKTTALEAGSKPLLFGNGQYFSRASHNSTLLSATNIGMFPTQAGVSYEFGCNIDADGSNYVGAIIDNCQVSWVCN